MAILEPTKNVNTLEIMKKIRETPNVRPPIPTHTFPEHPTVLDEMRRIYDEYLTKENIIGPNLMRGDYDPLRGVIGMTEDYNAALTGYRQTPIGLEQEPGIMRLLTLIPETARFGGPSGLGAGPRIGFGKIVEEESQNFLNKSIDDVERALKIEQESDYNKLVRALGSEEEAREFTRLEKAQNSMDTRKADFAAIEFNKKYGNLTKEQERLIYGFGENQLSIDELKEIRKAFLDTDWAEKENINEISKEATWALRNLTKNDLETALSGTGNGLQQANTIRFMRSFHELRRKGLNEQQIVESFINSMERSGFSREDAKEIVYFKIKELLGIQLQKSIER